LPISAATPVTSSGQPRRRDGIIHSRSSLSCSSPDDGASPNGRTRARHKHHPTHEKACRAGPARRPPRSRYGGNADQQLVDEAHPDPRIGEQHLQVGAGHILEQLDDRRPRLKRQIVDEEPAEVVRRAVAGAAIAIE
jgi:hypothetical protein